MIRTVLTEIGLFLTPFVLYAAFLLARAPVCWRRRPGQCRALAALVDRIARARDRKLFLMLAQFSGAPPGATYVPAHIENGKLVPGATR